MPKNNVILNYQHTGAKTTLLFRYFLKDVNFVKNVNLKK